MFLYLCVSLLLRVLALKGFAKKRCGRGFFVPFVFFVVKDSAGRRGGP